MNAQETRRLRTVLVFNAVVGLLAVSPLLVVVACWDIPNFQGARTGPGPSVLFFGLAVLTIPAGAMASLLGSLWLASDRENKTPPKRLF